jgi:hypothetical protein
MAHYVWLGANVLLLLLFIFSVAVQYNDPDPVRWMTIYGLAGVASGLALAGWTRWWFAAPVGAVAFVWGLTIAPRILGKVRFTSMFSAWEMENVGIEEAREMYGLFIVAGWMAAITIASVR